MREARRETETALSVGVRMSKPPLIASTGTSGSGPAPSGAPPAGDGHLRQNCALPRRVAQTPNGPNEPGGSASRAALASAGRSATAVSDCHGNGPSRHVVAAKRPVLRSSGASTDARLPRGRTRATVDGNHPGAPRGTTAGSAAARPGLRSASSSTERRSSSGHANSATSCRRGSRTEACDGRRQQAGSTTAATSPAKSGVANRQPPPRRNT